MRRAQAAMEFLMTYGWAILVVLAAIGALAYFGVLSPDRFLPEKCTLPSGVACLDFTASSTSIVMSIQNSGGFDMNPVAVSLISGTGASAITVPCTQGTGTALVDGAKDSFTCPATADFTDSVYPSGKFKAAINMTYTNQQTTMDHTKSGELIVKI